MHRSTHRLGSVLIVIFLAFGITLVRMPGAHAADDFGDAVVLPNWWSFVAPQDTTGATTERGEPDASCRSVTPGPGTHSVWFRLSGWGHTVSASTTGSDYDTILSVYTGFSLATLTEVACSDDVDFPADKTSAVEFMAEYGTTYYIRISEYDTPGSGGAAELHITHQSTQPDDVFVPGQVNSLPFHSNLSVTDMTLEDFEQGNLLCTNPNWVGSRSVWYRYVPASSGNVVVTTNGSDYQTVVMMYSSVGDEADDLIEETCIEGDPSSFFTTNLTGGEIYYFRVASFDGGGTTARLNFNILDFDAPFPECHGAFAQIIGGNGDDVLTGTSDDDVVIAYGGADKIRGLGGNDKICADGGKDKVWGNAGDDTIYGGGGNDTLHGSGGNDTIDGQGNADKVSGGGGGDTLTGGAGSDVLEGEGGDDTLMGGKGADQLRGGKGIDVLKGGPGNDACAGGEFLYSC